MVDLSVMKAKRLFRGPVFWVAMAALLVLLATNIIASANAPTPITTSEAYAVINAGKVKEAVIVDPDQSLTLTLLDGTRQRAEFLVDQGLPLTELLQERTDAGQTRISYSCSQS